MKRVGRALRTPTRFCPLLDPTHRPAVSRVTHRVRVHALMPCSDDACLCVTDLTRDTTLSKGMLVLVRKHALCHLSLALYALDTLSFAFFFISAILPAGVSFL